MNRPRAFVVIVGFLLEINSGAAPVTVCDEATLRAALANGGEISFAAPTTIRNGTFVHNGAAAGGFAPGSFPLFNGAVGGAIACANSTLRIEYSTIASNAVNNFTNSGRGGGVYQSGASPFLLASILAGNTTNVVFGKNVFPASVNGSFTLSSDSTGISGISLLNVDPQLDRLAHNGGPVRTIALLPGSPAINGVFSGCSSPADARGVRRPQHGACDLGAFEQTFMTVNFLPTFRVVITYSGVPNEIYALQSFSNLIDWEPVLEQPSRSGTMIWEVPATAPNALFRAKLLP